MSETRTPTMCDQCGQEDTAPKWNHMDALGKVESKHFDCTSVAEKDLLRRTSERDRAIVDASVDGKQNGDLLKVINKLDAAPAETKTSKEK